MGDEQRKPLGKGAAREADPWTHRFPKPRERKVAYSCTTLPVIDVI